MSCSAFILSTLLDVSICFHIHTTTTFQLPTQKIMTSTRKFVIQMSGAPGSGKSTIAKLLAGSIDGVVINHDLLKSFFLDTDLSLTLDQSAKIAYSLDWVLAEDMLKQGRSVVMDCTCNYPEVLDNGAALAERYGCEYWYVECRVTDLEVLDRRLRGRVAMRSQRTAVDCPPPDGVGKAGEDRTVLFKKWIEDPCRPQGNCIVVESTRGSEECVRDILMEIGILRVGQIHSNVYTLHHVPLFHRTYRCPTLSCVHLS